MSSEKKVKGAAAPLLYEVRCTPDGPDIVSGLLAELSSVKGREWRRFGKGRSPIYYARDTTS